METAVFTSIFGDRTLAQLFNRAISGTLCVRSSDMSGSLLSERFDAFSMSTGAIFYRSEQLCVSFIRNFMSPLRDGV